MGVCACPQDCFWGHRNSWYDAHPVYCSCFCACANAIPLGSQDIDAHTEGQGQGQRDKVPWPELRGFGQQQYLGCDCCSMVSVEYCLLHNLDVVQSGPKQASWA